jgi:hypothetical protein
MVVGVMWAATGFMMFVSPFLEERSDFSHHVDKPANQDGKANAPNAPGDPVDHSMFTFTRSGPRFGKSSPERNCGLAMLGTLVAVRASSRFRNSL